MGVSDNINRPAYSSVENRHLAPKVVHLYTKTQTENYLWSMIIYLFFKIMIYLFIKEYFVKYLRINKEGV